MFENLEMFDEFKIIYDGLFWGQVAFSTETIQLLPHGFNIDEVHGVRRRPEHVVIQAQRDAILRYLGLVILEVLLDSVIVIAQALSLVEIDVVDFEVGTTYTTAVTVQST